MLKELDFNLKFDTVKTSILFEDQDFILEVNPMDDPAEIFSWCLNNRVFIEDMLIQHGGIAFRGFGLTPREFRELAQIISPVAPLSYTGGIGPRKNFGDGTYLSTTVDKRCEIPQHHEMSYFRTWPMKIFFYCETPSSSGGETTLVSTRTFMKKIDPEIVERFERREVMYLRNYIEGINSKWEDSFETTDHKTVERLCRELGFKFEWLSENRLRTRNIAQGIARHPITNEKIWHNHAHLYNMFCGQQGVLTPSLRLMREAYAPATLEKMMQMHHEELPANTYYGNGELFESDIIEEISNLFLAEKVGFVWEAGDFILLDNMLAFHGRNPYEGDQRKILTILK